MDLPVEATVHLNIFQDETEVRQILRSYGFEVKDLSRNKVHVRGSFLKLSPVKAQLEKLLKAQTQTTVYSSPHHSGAIPKNYYSNSSLVSDGNTSRLASTNNPLHASPSSPSTSSSQVSDTFDSRPASPQYKTSSSPRPDPRHSVRSGSESFVVEGDVYTYAKQLRQKDINKILESHNVSITVKEVGESCSITLKGKSARTAAGKLQGFLIDLTTSLRTQEVPHKDMDHNGKDLFMKIQKNRNIYNSVVVCEMNDRLHLIGPSFESYDLKQKLLGKWLDQSGRTGRTFDGNSRRRSSSLPAVNRKNTTRDSGAVSKPSPVRAAGYSPSKYQFYKHEVAEPEGGAFGEGSLSESQIKRTNGYPQETQYQFPKSQVRKQLLSFNPEDILSKLKGSNKKKK